MINLLLFLKSKKNLEDEKKKKRKKDQRKKLKNKDKFMLNDSKRYIIAIALKKSKN